LWVSERLGVRLRFIGLGRPLNQHTLRLHRIERTYQQRGRTGPVMANAENVQPFIHAGSHHVADGAMRETEAEAVALVVGQGVGVNAAQSASYIQLYQGDAALLTESLAAVQRVSAGILSAITSDGCSQQQGTGITEQVNNITLEPERARASLTGTAIADAV
jgi:hypothetical protein